MPKLPEKVELDFILLQHAKVGILVCELQKQERVWSAGCRYGIFTRMHVTSAPWIFIVKMILLFKDLLQHFQTLQHKQNLHHLQFKSETCQIK